MLWQAKAISPKEACTEILKEVSIGGIQYAP